ncbi:hypothetical protein NDU88_004457, partial [Pleurodeles waltl]
LLTSAHLTESGFPPTQKWSHQGHSWGALLSELTPDPPGSPLGSATPSQPSVWT